MGKGKIFCNVLGYVVVILITFVVASRLSFSPACIKDDVERAAVAKTIYGLNSVKSKENNDWYLVIIRRDLHCYKNELISEYVSSNSIPKIEKHMGDFVQPLAKYVSTLSDNEAYDKLVIWEKCAGGLSGDAKKECVVSFVKAHFEKEKDETAATTVTDVKEAENSQ